MKAAKKLTKRLGLAKKSLRKVRKKIGKTGQGIIAGITGAVLMAGNAGKAVKNKVSDIKDGVTKNNKKSKEVITMKKSTFVAILVALAAVAGVLAALYFYVIRREKELDEYEQLLFSEDMDDDLDDIEAEDAVATAKA